MNTMEASAQVAQQRSQQVHDFLTVFGCPGGSDDGDGISDDTQQAACQVIHDSSAQSLPDLSTV